MDIITDLTAEAVFYLTIFQDICKENPPKQFQDKAKNAFLWQIVDFSNLHDRCNEYQVNRIMEMVWSSQGAVDEQANRENGKIFFFSVCEKLVDWLERSLKEVDSDLDQAKANVYASPFFWRGQIRRILYDKPDERIKLAEILHYMPLQIIQALKKRELGIYKQRLYQVYTPFPLSEAEIITPDSPEPVLSKLIAKRDRVRLNKWWKDRRTKLKDLFNTDQLLTELTAKEIAIPFETLFSSELDEIERSRGKRLENRKPNTKWELNLKKNNIMDKEGEPVDWQMEFPDYGKKKLSNDPMVRAEQMELAGLAFSGGGIRSATFNLGVLQKLAGYNLLPRFDYLSTVSGGGYIGSWLAALTLRVGSITKVSDRLCPQVSADPLAEEVRPIRWLRMYSNYLTPNASIMSADAWTVGITWLRNTILNQLILLLLLITVLSGIAILYEVWHQYNVVAKWDGLIIGLIVIVGAALAGFGMRAFDRERPPQSFINLKLSAYLAHILVIWGVIAAVYATTRFTDSHNIVLYNTYKKKVDFMMPYVATASFVGMMIIACIGRYYKSKSGKAVKPVVADHRWLLWAEVAIVIAFIITTWGLLMAGLGYFKNERCIIGGSIAVVTIALLVTGMGWYYNRKLTNSDTIEEREANQDRIKRKVRGARIWAAIIITSYIAVIGGVYLLAGAWELMGQLSRLTFPNFIGFGDRMVLVLGIPIVLEAVCLTVVIRMAFMGSLFPDGRREWWGRMGAMVHRFMLIWIIITAGALIIPDIIRLKFHEYFSLPLLGGWSGIIAFAVKLAFQSKSPDGQPKKGTASITDMFTRFAPYLFMLGFLLIGAYTLTFLRNIPIGNLKINDYKHCMVIMAASAILTLLFSWRVGVNEFSLHHFYRNRLTRAYLGATRRRTSRENTANSFTGFDSRDDINMTELAGDSYTGPYPLINTTLNASTVSELDRQDRKAESFLFSPLYCGFDFSPTRSAAYTRDQVYEYGYRPTGQYTGPCGPTVGTAMAISGAAVSPNQGYHSSAATAFLLTVFNVRLGCWLGNPRRGSWKESEPPFGLSYLIADMGGNTNINSDYVSISDGGHFDNMGLYELIRRRCKYIVLGDAEEDQKSTCEGLANAIRRCRIDFGVEIDLDVTPILNKDEKTGYSKAHIVGGKIKYPGPDGMIGHILYIKTSLTGSEEVDIREYFKSNPEFPQQSTGDQFFNEAQFESYRKLGMQSFDKVV
ncbi:MAG: patatin-like phospholipase family protein [Bacteroidota bacterium]